MRGEPKETSLEGGSDVSEANKMSSEGRDLVERELTTPTDPRHRPDPPRQAHLAPSHSALSHAEGSADSQLEL